MGHQHKWIDSNRMKGREQFSCECGLLKVHVGYYWHYFKHGRFVTRRYDEIPRSSIPPSDDNCKEVR